MTFSLTRIRSASHRPVRATPLGLYLTVWQQRRELARMTDDRLRDMGISPAEATVEAARPFWDLPDSQRR